MLRLTRAFPFAIPLATLALLFIAPLARDQVVVIQGTLVVFACGTGFLLAIESRRQWSAAYSYSCFATWAVVAFVASYSPLYFSDDAIRHIHDGFYLLRGVDVYAIAPAELPMLLDRLPNHPQLPTIYFATTQLLAIAGTAIHLEFGHRTLLGILHVSLAWFVFLQLSPHRQKDWLLFLISPATLIVFASGHTDLTGILLIAVGIVTFARYPFLSGVVHAFATATKPDAIIWIVRASVRIVRLIHLRIHQRPARFCAGYGSVIVLLVLFSFLILWPNSASWSSFRGTLELFANDFLAYNPLVDLLTSAYPEEKQSRMVRWNRYVILGIAGFTILGLGLRRHKQRRYTRAMREIAAVVAFALVFMRGVWHPWYFLWPMLALYVARQRRWAGGVLVVLPLFYLPVVALRAHGGWQGEFGLFYVSVPILFLLWLLLTNRMHVDSVKHGRRGFAGRNRKQFRGGPHRPSRQNQGQH